MKYVILLLNLFISFLTFGQGETKIYYDSEWNNLDRINYADAKYYRRITFDKDWNPTGIVKNYYITGELQWEGYLIYIDGENISEDLLDGHCIWYYKDGTKSKEVWYEKGNVEGDWVEYYQSGRIQRKCKFSKGKIVGHFYLECDDFGNCQKTFFEDYSTEGNSNNWPLVADNNQSAEIIYNRGLLMSSKIDKGFGQLITVPLDLENNFEIQTSFTLENEQAIIKNGILQASGQGIIWGFKDWENFYYYLINSSGYFRIGTFSKGVHLNLTEWIKTSEINKNTSENLIKIIRADDKMHFSINGKIVYSDDFYLFTGNQIGYYFSSGIKEVLYKYLLVRQDIPRDGIDLKNPYQERQDNGWQGNGSGFFISNNGYIATNYHVIEDANEIEVEFVKNGVKKNFSAKVIQVDKQNDLAIIKITDENFMTFSKIPYNFKTNITDVGSNVFALGYPMALTVMGTEIKFTDGKISSKTGFQGDITTYQTTTPIQPGNSGGPLFDFDGNLIGINSAILRPDVADNVSYSIKSSYLKNLIEVLDYKISLPNDKTIATKTLTEKIKILSDYVVLIKTK